MKKNKLMKLLKVLILLNFLISCNAYARDVILISDPNSEPYLSGYILFYGNQSNCSNNQSICDKPVGDYQFSKRFPILGLADPSNPEYKITNLDDTKNYYFALKAYSDEEKDENGKILYRYSESDYSNQVHLRVELQPPKKLRWWQKIISWFRNMRNSLIIKRG
jgi:hypothetical protein